MSRTFNSAPNCGAMSTSILPWQQRGKGWDRCRRRDRHGESRDACDAVVKGSAASAEFRWLS
jgi:hypothetical protein